MDFAHDVPQSEVDARNRRPAHDAVAMPEMLAIHHLPQVLDARWVFTDEQLRQIFNRAHNGARVPFERGLTPTPKAGLIGQHFDENPVAHARVANVRLDFSDFHVMKSVATLIKGWNVI